MEYSSILVSIVMPVYNGEKYLNEAIESVINQTYSNFEFIIINDGSSDKTEQIIINYQDTRIKYISNLSNLGLIATLNYGLKLAKGDYIVRMDQDDICFPDRITKQVAFMEQNKDYVLVGSYAKVIDVLGVEQGSINYYTEDIDLRYALTQYCPFIHPSVIIRTCLLKKNNLNYEEDFLHAEDYRLWTILSKHGKIKNLPEYLIKYRVHSEQTSSVHKTFQLKQMQLIQESYLKDLYPLTAPEIVSLVFQSQYLNKIDFTEMKDVSSFLNEIYDVKVESALQRFLIRRWKILIQFQTKYTLKTLFEILFFKLTWKSKWSIKELFVLIYKTRLW